MYSRQAIRIIAEQQLKSGQAMFFDIGYFYGLHDQRLFVCDASGCGPPPYFAKVFTASALKSKRDWNRYAKRHRLHGVRHELRRCPKHKVLEPSHFLGTIHDANVTRAWENPNLVKRMGSEITDDKEKTQILERFGVTYGA